MHRGCGLSNPVRFSARRWVIWNWSPAAPVLRSLQFVSSKAPAGCGGVVKSPLPEQVEHRLHEVLSGAAAEL